VKKLTLMASCLLMLISSASLAYSREYTWHSFSKTKTEVTENGVHHLYTINVGSVSPYPSEASYHSFEKALEEVVSDAMDEVEGKIYSYFYTDEDGNERVYTLETHKAIVQPLVKSSSFDRDMGAVHYEVEVNVKMPPQNNNESVTYEPTFRQEDSFFRKALVKLNEQLIAHAGGFDIDINLSKTSFNKAYQDIEEGVKDYFGGFDKTPHKPMIEIDFPAVVLTENESMFIDSIAIYDLGVLMYPAPITRYSRWSKWRKSKEEKCEFKVYPSLYAFNYRKTPSDFKGMAGVELLESPFVDLIRKNPSSDLVQISLKYGESISGLGLAISENKPIRRYYVEKGRINPGMWKRHHLFGNHLVEGCYEIF